MYGLYYVEVRFFYQVVQSFYHEIMANFVKCFFSICLEDNMILSLILLMWCHMDWVRDVEPSLYLWNKYHLFMVYDPFDVLYLVS